MTRRYTLEEVKRISIEKGTEFLSDTYTSNHSKYWFKCPICKEKVSKMFSDVIKGHILCLKCSSKLPKRLYDIEEVKEKAKSVGCEFLDDEYLGAKHKHTFLCSKCKENTFKRNLRDVIRKDRPRNLCLKCTEESYHDKQKLSEEKFNNYKNHCKENQKIIILTEYENYINSKSKNLECHCLVCNNKKLMSISQLGDLEIGTGIGCGCSYISYGERITLDFLEKNGVVYEFQKRLPNGLFSDFEIKLDNKKVLLLEIDGSQHYIFQKRFHKDQEEFERCKNNDRIKEQYYLDNGNLVTRIKYEKSHGLKGWKNDNIQEKLNDILNGNYGKVLRKEPNLNYNITDIARIHTQSKKILVYTLDGKFYKEYSSLTECNDELKISNTSKEQNNKVKCGDYMIRDYVENYPLAIEPYAGNLRKIKVYKDNIYLDTYDGLRAITRELGVNRDSISKYLKNIPVKFKDGDYHFEYTY